ncbi:hypothetical protein GCM10010401_15970 [Rarobacter faecitabidus]|uniref:Uncharacterized protein n=1 Tax=Rarobacter faecitabidus TaxID=13243 RepID=A0A542ZXC3_RARFA|nr:hypothetical protein FB461_1534 [Rarobacter faecitabidus]
MLPGGSPTQRQLHASAKSIASRLSDDAPASFVAAFAAAPVAVPAPAAESAPAPTAESAPTPTAESAPVPTAGSATVPEILVRQRRGKSYLSERGDHRRRSRRPRAAAPIRPAVPVRWL